MYLICCLHEYVYLIVITTRTVLSVCARICPVREFVPECPKAHADKGMIEFFSTMAYMASCNWSSIMDTYDSCSSYDCARNLQFVEGMICPLIDPVEDQSAGDLNVVYQNIIKESLATDGYSALSVDDCVFHITRGDAKYV